MGFCTKPGDSWHKPCGCVALHCQKAVGVADCMTSLVGQLPRSTTALALHVISVSTRAFQNYMGDMLARKRPNLTSCLTTVAPLCWDRPSAGRVIITLAVVSICAGGSGG